MSEQGYSSMQTALYALFAAIAGALGYVTRALQRGARPALARGAVEAGSAGFVGVLTLLACDATGLSQSWTGVTVGVLGWLGSAASIQLLERVIYRQLGITTPRADAGESGG